MLTTVINPRDRLYLTNYHLCFIFGNLLILQHWLVIMIIKWINVIHVFIYTENIPYHVILFLFIYKTTMPKHLSTKVSAFDVKMWIFICLINGVKILMCHFQWNISRGNDCFTLRHFQLCSSLFFRLNAQNNAGRRCVCMCVRVCDCVCVSHISCIFCWKCVCGFVSVCSATSEC